MNSADGMYNYGYMQRNSQHITMMQSDVTTVGFGSNSELKIVTHYYLINM